mmetsp:Transcript_10398/g.29055  ORF Transcript_10398/g.29055 Transcript_10398/m.29055 type:complete len:227 (+) Transcript_10398:1892-2572(+)
MASSPSAAMISFSPLLSRMPGRSRHSRCFSSSFLAFSFTSSAFFHSSSAFFLSCAAFFSISLASASLPLACSSRLAASLVASLAPFSRLSASLRACFACARMLAACSARSFAPLSLAAASSLTAPASSTFFCAFSSSALAASISFSASFFWASAWLSSRFTSLCQSASAPATSATSSISTLQLDGGSFELHGDSTFTGSLALPPPLLFSAMDTAPPTRPPDMPGGP